MKRTLWRALIVLCIWQITAEALISLYSKNPLQDSNFDYIVVLSASNIRNDPIVIDRAKNAAEAAKNWPNAKIIITGLGERDNEPGEEALLKEYVLNNGVAADKIIDETHSYDTWTNIANSKKLIPEDSRIVLITTEFHQARALAIARVQGLRASVYGRDPRPYANALYYYIYERGAAIKWLFLFMKYEIMSIL